MYLMYGLIGALCFFGCISLGEEFIQKPKWLIRLDQHDWIYGQIKEINTGDLMVSSDRFSKDLSLSFKNILEMYSSEDFTKPSSSGAKCDLDHCNVSVELVQGDVVYGRWLGMSRDEVVVDSPWMGELHIKRAMVARIKGYYAESKMHVRGINISGYQMSEGTSWRYVRGDLQVVDAGEIWLPVDFPERGWVGFEILIDGGFEELALKLVAHDDCLPLSVSIDRVRLTRILSDVRRGQEWLPVVVKSDLKSSTYQVLVGGQVYQEGRLIRGADLENQRGFGFKMSVPGRCKIRSLEMGEWFGTGYDEAMNQRSILENEFKGLETDLSLKAGKERYVLRNGDDIEGVFESISVEGVCIQRANDGGICIPLQRLYEVEGVTMLPLQYPIRKSSDIRFYLKDGSSFVAPIVRFNDGLVRVSHQALGECDLDLRHVTRIQFHVHSQVKAQLSSPDSTPNRR